MLLMINVIILVVANYTLQLLDSHFDNGQTVVSASRVSYTDWPGLK